MDQGARFDSMPGRIYSLRMNNCSRDDASSSLDRCERENPHPEAIARVRAALPGDRECAGLAELFRALGDLTRVRLLAALAESELCVCDLAELAGLSSSAVSHQLRLLRMARLVRCRKEGKNVYYALDDDHVRRLLAQGLDHVREG